MKTLYFLFFLLTSIPLSFAQGFLGLDRIICTGGNTTLDAGSGYDEYHWSTGETSQTIIASAGTYSADRRIVSSSQTVDVNQPDGGFSVSYSADMSQSFTMNSTGYLKAVDLVQSGYNQVATSPNFIITKGDGPSGTVISTSTATIPATGAGPQNIDLSITIPGNILVYKDSVYTFTFSNGGAENINLKAAGSDVYAGGTFYLTGVDYGNTLEFAISIQEVTIQRDTVNVTENGPCTAITDAAHHAEVTIYPNPVKDNHLHLEGIYDRVELSDLQGNVVVSLTPVEGDVILPPLNKGMYVLKAETADGKILMNKLSVE